MSKFCVGIELLDMLDGGKVELKYYILKQEKFYAELEKTYVTYGVQIEKNSSHMVESDFVEDITCDSDKINDITCKLKENKVLPIHLKDIIIDMIS